MLPPNIRVDRNCQPTWVTQNAIPEEQELILLGGGIRCPPPTDTGLMNLYPFCVVLYYFVDSFHHLTSGKVQS